MLNIELKEDSSEKLASVQGKPTKHYLFSQEFNAIVQKINEVYLAQKKKIENTRYKSPLSGENVIIPFQAAGQSHYSVTHAALVSVAGFTTAGLTTPMYEGQDVIFENQTGHDIALKDSFGVDTSFVIGDDLIVPNEGKIWFRFGNNELELIDKNWFGIKEVVNPENLGEFIDGLDSKTNIKDDDKFIISDSEDSLKSKKTRFLDLKTKLKSYFDTFYLSLSVFNDFVEDVFDSLDRKLDKSTTASSVYSTNAAGGQTMIPLSDFGTVKGTGTANRIAKFTASGTIGDSQIFDIGTSVGIGTTSPTFTLDVQAITSNIRVLSSLGENRAYTQFSNTGGTFNIGLDSSTGRGLGTNVPYAGIIMHYGNYPIVIGTNSTERVRISNTGNVGFGTTTPSARLDVKAQGALATDIAFRVRNSTDTRNFLVVNGAGDVYNNGASGISTNTFFGENVGRNTTGDYNTAIGASALRANTIGGSNTALGQSAGRLTSNGSNNTISNNSLFLGGDTRANADNQTNQIVIGDSAIGLGSNSVVLGNDSITKTQLRGQVIMGSFASAPTGIEGAIYYDSTTKKHYGFNGTTWNALY